VTIVDAMAVLVVMDMVMRRGGMKKGWINKKRVAGVVERES
jgi:hypothetical protein